MDGRNIYPAISTAELSGYNKTIKSYFESIVKLNACPQKLCLSASLFKKNARNTFLDEFPVDEQLWQTKYYDHLVANIKNLVRIGEQYKLRLYLANDLSHMVRDLIALAPTQLEIVLMKTSSIGHSPGAMWRFLALNDTTVDIVGVVDVDEPINVKYIQTLLATEKHVQLCKPVAALPTVHVCDGKIWGQYHLFQAGRFAMRPTISGIQELLCGALQFACDLRFRREIRTIFNVPRAGHPEGWGRHPFIYGFDETFLKCILYPMIPLQNVILVGDASNEARQLESCFAARGSSTC